MFPDELIGEEVEIIESTNPDSLGIKGKIIDETKQTIKIEKEDGKEVVLLKNTVTFRLKSGKVVSGKGIMKRPEDRLKG